MGSVQCLCNTNESQRISAVGSLSAHASKTQSIKQSVINVAKLSAKNSKRVGLAVSLLGECFGRADENVEHGNPDGISCLGIINNPHLAISGVAESNLAGLGLCNRPNVDKFAGNFDTLKSISLFKPDERLYPSSDMTTTLSGVSFVDRNLNSGNLYQSIDEGIFTGRYITNNASNYSKITDDKNTFIQPISTGVDANLRCRFGVNPMVVKAEESFFVMRASAPLRNTVAGSAPLYNINNIKLLDPSGDLIIKYKDLDIKGDSVRGQAGISGNFATYISEPEVNLALLNTYDPKYPRIGKHFVGASGYSITFDVDINCMDDPFGFGHDVGHQEFTCSGVSIASGFFLGEQVTTIDNIKISAIEIMNRGSKDTVEQQYLNLFSLPVETGERLIRHIFPTQIFPSGFDTTIAPSSVSKWQSSAYPDASGVYSNSGIVGASILRDTVLPSYLRLESASVPDSGKLTIKFEDVKQSSTTTIVHGNYDNSSFSIDYNKTKVKTFPLSDTFYSDIDSIKLKVTARKASGSRDFALDIVGYSDDKLLAVTNKIGGFLQNTPDSALSAVNTSGTEELGISAGPISNNSDFDLSLSTIPNSGGDHSILSSTPLINSTTFKEYEIPLRIYSTIPRLGRIRKFDQSTYFENIILDIYPIPSGADIAEMKLEVQYRPANALPVSVVGHGREQPLARNTVILNVDENLSTYPAVNDDNTITALSNISGIPHGFASPSSIKTNYSRRWRGVVGKEYASNFDSAFDFSVQKHELRDPFQQGFYNFAITSGNKVFSRHTDNSGEYKSSGIFNATLQNSVYHHVGWRFNSSGILNTGRNYRTTDWASGTHPLKGKIADAFAHVVRISGEHGNITFPNVDTNSSGHFTAFVRFTPDETVSGVGYNLFNSGVLVSKHDDFSIRYSGGYLQGTAINTSGDLVLVTDPLAYSGYQYPLSVLLGYDGDTLSLYTDNELSQHEFTKLRAESSSFTKRNTSKDIVLGYSSGDHVGMNMFVSEFGFSSGVVPSGANDLLITVDDVFDSHRMTFSDRPASPSSSGTRDSLWKYLNQSANKEWMLGAFRTCHFGEDFDQLESRTDKTYLEHTFDCDGTDYANNTDMTLPTNIVTDNLAYHTQIENDFVRFFLSDIPDIQDSGQFYSSDVRITKNLPRGYNFNEEAFVVETVVDNDMTNLVQWPDENIGPRLIVSLYTPSKIPQFRPDRINYGLVNRHIHYLEPSGCYRKIKSTFDSKNLFDTTTEPWSSFEPELYVSEFNHRYFSNDVNEMFIQYDIAYPSNTNYESRVRLHASEVKLDKALVDLPLASGGFDPSFNLYVSGNFTPVDFMDLFTVGHSGVEFNTPSGLTMFASGLTPSGLESTPSGLYLVLPSGTDKVSESVNLYVSALDSFSTSSSFGAWEVGDPVIGLGFMVNNEDNLVTSGTSFSLSTINEDPYPSSISSLQLITPQPKTIIGRENATNLSIRGPYSTYVAPPSSSMPMHIQVVDTASAFSRFPFNLFTKFIPESLNNDLGLYTVNIPAIDVTVDQQQTIQWNGDNVGSDILVTNNNYSSLSADDEIRGVTTICFGSCDSDGTCSTRQINTHGLDWNNSSCVDGGIARAQTLYTNSGTIAFGGDTNGYDQHFYGIRKLTGLIPSYPYTITIGGFTGSAERIDIPREFREVEYGSNDEVGFSGIKHFYHDPQAVHAKYGKDIVVRGDLMAIGAPQYTLTDSSGDISDAGAVFLYRRNSAPSGYDWSSQQHKADWSLEQILTLPSGFQRDYKYQALGPIEDEQETFFNATKNYWNIGQLGRNFGYSVDIVSDPNTPSGDVVVVGAPRGVFDREFDPLSARRISMAVLVITDELTPPGDRLKDLSSFIANRNRYFLHVADPPFQIVPKYIILSATKNTILNNGEIFGNQTVPDEVVGGYIDQITHPASGSVQSPEIEGQIKDIFNREFPPTGTLANSGIPAILGLFVDTSASMGRELVTPAIDNFVQYYKDMSLASGVRNYNDANPTSGIFYDITSDLNRENWQDAAYEVARNVISNDTVLNNIDIFTSGYSEAFVPDNVRFQVLPPSGGRVYVFEQDVVKSGIFYDTNKPMFELTHEFGFDRYEFDRHSPNERFGHDVSISQNKEFIAVGSPYYEKKGVTVYERNKSYNLNALYDIVPTWISSKIGEDPSDVSSIYYTLNSKYNALNDGTVSQRQVGKALYELLNPSGRMSLRVFKEISRGFEEKYSKVFDYKNDYNFTGSWTFVPEFHAPVPRVGYSVALSESGDMLAVGCPTDSMNQFDDSNVYHRNIKLCPNDLGLDGLGYVPGYVSPVDSESGLVTGSWSQGGMQGTAQSYVNAGAVQLFDSRRYYPHSGIVEYGKFGNLHKVLASGTDEANYFDFVSGVFNNYESKYYQETSFDDPEIPQDAGLLFITTPTVDALSQEVLDNIKDWLALGDRNLVLVGNDPEWERNGAYKDGNDIINNILDNLGSRVRIRAARSPEHALAYPVANSMNVIPASVPEHFYETYISRQNMFASGVGDIRFHDPSIQTFNHSCNSSETTVDQILNYSDELNPYRLSYDAANMTCELPIQHSGDLRAQWYDLCLEDGGRFSANYIRTPMNIQAAYGIIPGLVGHGCHPGYRCWVDEICKDLWKPKTENELKAPTPVLAAAEFGPDLFKTLAGDPERTVTVQDGFNTIVTGFEIKESFAETDFDIFAFNVSGVHDSTAYAGDYNAFETNYQLKAAIGGEFFKPDTLDETYILQSRDVSVTKEAPEDSLEVDLAYVAAEEQFPTNPDKKPSYVSMVATTATESKEILTEGDEDKMVYFYKNILNNGLDLSDNGYGAPVVNLGQLGGWTNRASFEDGYAKTHLYNSLSRGIWQTAGLFNGTRGASNGIDLKVTENVSFGEDGATLSGFDVLWIANTSSRPSNDDINKLKEWLSLGNKRLIITYGHDTTVRNPDPLKPAQSHSDAAYVVCSKLGIQMAPVYLEGKGRYAEFYLDNTSRYDLPEPAIGDTLQNNFNLNSQIYSNKLPNMFPLSTNSNRFLYGNINQTLFTPIRSNINNYIAIYGELLNTNPRNYRRPNGIYDTYTVDQILTYNNPGWSELVGGIPVDTVSTLDTPGASGYTIRVEVATESPSERNQRKVQIVTDGLARKIFNEKTQEYEWSTTTLKYLDENVRRQELRSISTGVTSEETILDDKVIDFGPFYATSSGVRVYVSTQNDLRQFPSKLLGPRIKSISVHPSEIIKTKTDKIVKEPIYKEVVIPATEPTEINLGGKLREISTHHQSYCPSQEDECLTPFKIPFNDRKGPVKLTDPLASLSGNDVNVTKDGPVIVTQEFELFSAFDAGVARSRITVISDSSLIQGSTPYHPDDTKKWSHINFVRSLYPETYFPEDIIYNSRIKITAPERGSPAKWYGATGNSGLISRFIYNTGASTTTYAAGQFSDLESHYDPQYVTRPMEFCECDNAPYPCVADELEAAYNSGLLSNPLMQFTTTVSGKRYFDDLQLFKDTGDDYLDFDKYNDGYPGDLFGFSVALQGKRLLVGAPFSAFSSESGILEWSTISGVPSGQVPTGVTLSSNGGAGNVYMFEKTLKGSGNIFNITQNNSTTFLRQQFSEWQYMRKFRPSSINVGQDLTSALVSQSSVYYGTNTYADADVTSFGVTTDKFGYDVDIDDGVIAIGAPGHDFGNYVVTSTGSYISKEFGDDFAYPSRTTFDLGTSGSRISLPNSGVAILNNGAVYIYSEDYNFGTNDYEWRQVEKILPQGNKSQTQKEYSGFASVPVSGSENSNFGESVSVSRYARSDSDYVVGVGSKNHLYSSGTEASLDRGAAYTYDIILRKLPAATQPTGAFINARLYSEPSGVDGSAIQPIYNPILLNITNSGLDSQLVEQTGIIVTNNAGEIYLEVSGQDPSIYQYIKHRPYINAVDGAMLLGTKTASGIRMFVEGTPLSASGTPSGLSLFVKPNVTGVYSDNVYNYTGLGMSTFGAEGFASGLPSGLYLYNLGSSS